MSKLNDLVDDLVQAGSQGTDFVRDGNYLVAELAGQRTQRVRVTQVRDEARFVSVVAPSWVVPDKAEHRSIFLRRLWEINARTDLVAFGIDGHGRVVGACRHPVDTLDPEELESYVVTLVRECDRLEWVLTGEDRY